MPPGLIWGQKFDTIPLVVLLFLTPLTPYTQDRQKQDSTLGIVQVYFLKILTKLAFSRLRLFGISHSARRFLFVT